MHESSVYVRVAGPNRRISMYALLKGKSLTSIISLFFMLLFVQGYDYLVTYLQACVLLYLTL